MGMRAKTDERGVKVWRDDKAQYPRYSFSISKKNDAGEYDNFYMEIKFKKDLPEPDNGDSIIINDSFLSFNVWTDKDNIPFKHLYHVFCCIPKSAKSILKCR